MDKEILFIEIGNTNIKVVENSSNEIGILPSSKKNLLKILKSSQQKYVLNSNNKLASFLNKYHLKNKLWLFKINTYLDDFNFFQNIKPTEVGNDLLFLSLYLKNNVHSDGIVISHGTCLTSISKKNGQIVSISIGLGFNLTNIILNERFGFQYHQDLAFQFGDTTNHAINLHEIFVIKGIIETNKQWLSHNFPIVLTGNGFNEDWKNYLSKDYQNINFSPNLTLLSFRDWICHKFLK